MPVIPDSLKKASISKAGNIIVLGRMMYASVFTATRPSKSETDPKRFQWSTTVLIPEGSDLTVLKNAIKSVFEENVPEGKRATTKWKNPLKETAGEASLALYAEDYPFLVRPNAKAFQKDGKARAKPEVVDAHGQPVDPATEPEQTYNGRWCRVSLQPYWYPANDGSAGVSLGLVNVQLLYHDDPLAGGKAKASSDFEAVEGLEEMEEFA